MRMDRPNGVHNEERILLDRITQLKSILINQCEDGRWSCHLDGAVLAGRSGFGVRCVIEIDSLVAARSTLSPRLDFFIK